MPTPRFRRIGGTSWSVCFGTPPEGPCRLSGWNRRPTGIACIASTGRGLTAPPVSSCHRSNSWRSWQRSYPCRVSTWCATVAVWHRTARFGRRSFHTTPARRGWRRNEDGNPVLALDFLPFVNPQSGDFSPHHGDFLSTMHPVRIIEGAITQHRHHDAQQSIRNGA